MIAMDVWVWNWNLYFHGMLLIFSYSKLLIGIWNESYCVAREIINWSGL